MTITVDICVFLLDLFSENFTLQNPLVLVSFSILFLYTPSSLHVPPSKITLFLELEPFFFFKKFTISDQLGLFENRFDI